MGRRFQILKGPDRMQLFAHFALRQPTGFELKGGQKVQAVMNKVEFESADCHSWLIAGYLIGEGYRGGEKFEMFYVTKENPQSLGFIDIEEKS